MCMQILRKTQKLSGHPVGKPKKQEEKKAVTRTTTGCDCRLTTKSNNLVFCTLHLPYNEKTVYS